MTYQEEIDNEEWWQEAYRKRQPEYIFSECPRCGGAMQKYESTNSCADYYKCEKCDFRKPIYNGQIGIGNFDELFKGGE